MKTWRDLVYVAIVSLTGAGVITGVAWVGVWLIQVGYIWAAIFFWLVVVFWLYEVGTNDR